MSVLDSLTNEGRFYLAMNRLTMLAWKKGLTVEALLMMAELVDPLGDGDDDLPVLCRE